jgi:hypothetical protein
VSDPFWKSLVDRVREEEHREHLDPVRDRVEWRMPRPSVERELLEEMAGALCRAEQRVLDAIDALADLDPDADLERFERARAHALRVRRDLVIHREALHFPRDPELETHYPIPASRRR